MHWWRKDAGGGWATDHLRSLALTLECCPASNLSGSAPMLREVATELDELRANRDRFKRAFADYPARAE